MEEWLNSPSNVADRIDSKCDDLAEKTYKKYETMMKE